MRHNKLFAFLLTLLFTSATIQASFWPWSSKQPKIKFHQYIKEQEDQKLQKQLTPRKQIKTLETAELKTHLNLLDDSEQGISSVATSTPQSTPSPRTTPISHEETYIFTEEPTEDEKKLQEAEEAARFELLIEQGLVRKDIEEQKEKTKLYLLTNQKRLTKEREEQRERKKQDLLANEKSTRRAIEREEEHSKMALNRLAIKEQEDIEQHLWYPIDSVLLKKTCAMLLVYLNYKAGKTTITNWTEKLPMNIKNLLIKMNVPYDDIIHTAKSYQKYNLETFNVILNMVNLDAIARCPNISKMFKLETQDFEINPKFDLEVARALLSVINPSENDDELQTRNQLLESFSKEELIYIAAFIRRIPILYQPKFIDFFPNNREETFEMFF